MEEGSTFTTRPGLSTLSEPGGAEAGKTVRGVLKGRASGQAEAKQVDSKHAKCFCKLVELTKKYRVAARKSRDQEQHWLLHAVTRSAVTNLGLYHERVDEELARLCYCCGWSCTCLRMHLQHGSDVYSPSRPRQMQPLIQQRRSVHHSSCNAAANAVSKNLKNRSRMLCG